MQKDALATMLAKALVDPDYAAKLSESPEAAAEEAGVSLTEKDSDALRGIPASAMQAVADLGAKLRGAPKQQPQTGSRALDALAAVLDQQQQQGGLTRLQDLAALLDQQQQQTGSRALDALAAVLDQQQQQGGRDALENL
ncbi:Os1348 family NHLP clan protein, partial [Nocardia rhamnosiphila]|uniref:Os1348 family NHLP clan protein n=1 Tax=Nocardia rhamnosiphila TaxID=426716 RepID=UPI0033D4C1CC